MGIALATALSVKPMIRARFNRRAAGLIMRTSDRGSDRYGRFFFSENPAENGGKQGKKRKEWQTSEKNSQ